MDKNSNNTNTSPATSTASPTTPKKRGQKKGCGKVAGSGRKKGTPNRATTEFRKVFSNILQEEIDKNNIQLALQTILLESPKDYLNSIIKIAQFNLPQLQSVEFNGQAEVTNPFIEHMQKMAGLSSQIDQTNKK